jgi:tRNA (guanine-N7-)-methyltransferase
MFNPTRVDAALFLCKAASAFYISGAIKFASDMGKNKLSRFEEMKAFRNVIQFQYSDLETDVFQLKGKWHSDFFKNENPLVLELGCGKGEYAVNLGRRYPSKNFIGIDIKGSRMYVGARMALEEQLFNIGFLRTRIDFITALFAPNEVDEIWITFPDPQPHKPRKRLTSDLFLSRYSQLLKSDGIIHLKTDSVLLHEFTKRVVEKGQHRLIAASSDIYNDKQQHDAVLTEIQTTYEQRFLNESKPITYISFCLRQ